MAKKYVSNEDETIRLFESNFLEFLSRVHYTVPLYIFVPVIGYFLFQSIVDQNRSFLNILLWIGVGLFTWTVTEYTLHRFVFHFTPKGVILEKIHFLFHGVHHDYPSDSKRLVMPPALSIPLATGFYFLFKWIFDLNVSPMFAGFLVGYLCYDLTHYAIHHFNMHSSVWLYIKNHHMKHHYQDSTKGYGVSSPIWDMALDTMFPKKDKETV